MAEAPSATPESLAVSFDTRISTWMGKMGGRWGHTMWRISAFRTLSKTQVARQSHADSLPSSAIKTAMLAAVQLMVRMVAITVGPIH